jgi:hypothetical protein
MTVIKQFKRDNDAEARPGIGGACGRDVRKRGGLSAL